MERYETTPRSMAEIIEGCGLMYPAPRMAVEITDSYVAMHPDVEVDHDLVIAFAQTWRP